MKEKQKNLIISLTTSMEAIKSLLVDRLIKSILDQTVIPFKIILSINKEYVNYLSDSLKLLIKNNTIELIYIKEDLHYLNKYYYIPNKYKKNILVVVDDNIIFEKNAIENLLKSYILNPNAVSARRVYKMTFNNKGHLMPFNLWIKDYNREKRPKFYLFAIHGEGALFPPNALNTIGNFIFYFKKVMNASDFIIKSFELKENIKTVYVNNSKKYYPINHTFYEKYNKLLSISPNEYQLEEDFGKKINLSIYQNIIKEKVVIKNEIKEYFLNTINKNKVTNDTLLVSMTSYPSRIYGIYEVFISLLSQSANISSYQCFLTLSKEEFINGEKDLPLNV